MAVDTTKDAATDIDVLKSIVEVLDSSARCSISRVSVERIGWRGRQRRCGASSQELYVLGCARAVV
jgi:hypothetical protein